MNDNIRLAISAALGAAVAAGVAVGVAKGGDAAVDPAAPVILAPVVGRVEMNRNAGVCNGFVIDVASGAADPQLTGCDVLDAVDAAAPSPLGKTQVNRAVIEVRSDGTCDVAAGRYTPEGSAVTERTQGVACNLLPLPPGLVGDQS